MCDSIEEGGRRCPGACGEQRSAKDRARYAAKKARGATSPPTDGGGVAVLERSPELTEADRKAALDQQLSAAVYDARAYYYGDLDLPDGQPLDMEQVRAASAAHEVEMKAFEGKYGTPDKAIIAAGDVLAQKAEEYAGITAEEARESYRRRLEDCQARVFDLNKRAAPYEAAVDDAYSAYQTWRSIPESQRESDHRETLYNLHEEYLAAAKARTAFLESGDSAALREEFRALYSASDPESVDALQRLSNGYVRALSETRPLGGKELTFHEKTTKPARAVFNTAVEVFPTDWIEASNDRKPMYARIADSRAHYTDAIRVEKRVKETYTHRLIRDEQPEDSVYRTYEKIPYDPDRPETKNMYRATRYEVNSWTPKDQKPKGPRWEWYEGEDRPNGVWRRTEQRMQTISSETVPEIKTNKRSGPLGGPGVATAQHEFSHRCESSVPKIKDMEEDFLVRRTTDPVTKEREPLRTIEGHARSEKGWKDSFAHGYMGKYYRDGYREILSTGTESVFSGKFGGLIGLGQYKADHEYRSFILGILAVAKR